MSASATSNRSGGTYDIPSSDRVGRREGGGEREEYDERDTELSTGLFSEENVSEKSDGSSLVHAPAPLLQPQSLTSVTVYQTSPSHLAHAHAQNNGSNNSSSGSGSKPSEAVCLRARFHSNSIDTGASQGSKIADEIEDGKDQNSIELKRTPSFLQKLTGKGKSPTRTTDKDKKGFLGLFKRKKQLGFADGVISKMSSDEAPHGAPVADSDNK